MKDLYGLFEMIASVIVKARIPLLLEEAHQITFQQRCINSLTIKVYKDLNGHSPHITNDIFKLRENMYNIRNFHIFQTENLRSLKYSLMLFHIVPANSGNKCILISVGQLLQLFSKIALRLGNMKIVHVDLAKYLFKMSVISD